MVPTVLWEQPSQGECGPTVLEVVFEPLTVGVGTPVVHWEVADARGEAPMATDAGPAAYAYIGPFTPDTLADGTSHELLVYVTDEEAFGDEIFRGPTVVLRDCSP